MMDGVGQQLHHHTQKVTQAMTTIATRRDKTATRVDGENFEDYLALLDPTDTDTVENLLDGAEEIRVDPDAVFNVYELDGVDWDAWNTPADQDQDQYRPSDGLVYVQSDQDQAVWGSGLNVAEAIHDAATSHPVAASKLR